MRSLARARRFLAKPFVRLVPKSWRRTPRGQAMTEMALLTVLLIGWGAVMMYFFPDAFNALTIYMDSFYYSLSMPIP